MYVDLRPDRPDQFADSDSDLVEALVSFTLLFCFVMDVFKFQPFSRLTKHVVTTLYGSGRTFKLGRKFAVEGYLSDVSITIDEEDAVVSAFCWAS